MLPPKVSACEVSSPCVPTIPMLYCSLFPGAPVGLIRERIVITPPCRCREMPLPVCTSYCSKCTWHKICHLYYSCDYCSDFKDILYLMHLDWGFHFCGILSYFPPCSQLRLWELPDLQEKNRWNLQRDPPPVPHNLLDKGNPDLPFYLLFPLLGCCLAPPPPSIFIPRDRYFIQDTVSRPVYAQSHQPLFFNISYCHL